MSLSINTEDILKDFIDNILRTGGKIGLRGYYTGSVFSDLGYKENKDYTVTGCPSIYYEGRNFTISNEKVSKNLFNPIFNGSLILKTDLLKKHPKSLFIDQSHFYDFFLDARFFLINNLAFVDVDYKILFDIYVENRLKIWGDYRAWRKGIKGYSFSFGDR